MKKLPIAILCAAALTLTGCSKDLASDVSKFIEADGRSYGQTYEKGMNEYNQTEFFKFQAKEAYRAETVGDFYLDSADMEFLCVNVEVINTFDTEIPVGTYDFIVRWGDGEDDFSYAESQDDGFGFDNYPEDINLGIGKTAKGNVYFTIPKSAENLKLEYLECYTDEFEGNTFLINLGNPARQ
ncbi:MAG: DUF4352 domain-containing protein [Oscillospiraceae bacterium]